MIKEIRISNYKSLEKLKLELGRVNVFIGENGCGKSNILEAVALISAATNNKLDNEFLISRGVRVTEPKFMRSAFDKNNLIKPIELFMANAQNGTFSYTLMNDNQPYSKWTHLDYRTKFMIDSSFSLKIKEETIDEVLKNSKKIKEKIDKYIKTTQFGLDELDEKSKVIKDFLIYSPENKSLRVFEKEGQIEPLGINGEGLFKLLNVLNLQENKLRLEEIKSHLRLIDWFKDFEIPEGLVNGEKHLKIIDRFLDIDFSSFDQKSSNEGFLFLLFYFSLFVSSDTPSFFAIDNIDASLNPKLCSVLTKTIVELTKKYNKQVILTTHNPSVLDGLNLDDDDQRLFVIYRNKNGHTKSQRILKKNNNLENQEPVKLSEAFMRGYIGGLPKNF